MKLNRRLFNTFSSRSDRLHAKGPVGGRVGAALGMVMVFMLIMGVLATTLVGLKGNIGVEVSRDIGDVNAFWAAESGLELAKTIGQKKRKRYPVIPNPSGSGMLLGSNVLSGTIGTGRYSVTIVDDPDWDNTAHTLQKYVITAVGTALGGRTQVVSSHV